MMCSDCASASELWVFGYGSLKWRPGFDFAEQAPARLMGAHRALCVYSVVHRGTHAEPGLVLGLDKGGACRGVVFRAHQGPDETYVPGNTCVRGDMDEDWDVDLADFATFQQAFEQ